MISPPQNLSFAFFAICLIFTQKAHAHAFLAIPKARNVLANSYYCPHCLNAGGVDVTRGTNYPKDSNYGICGDRKAGPRDHESGGKFATGQITGRYEEGSAIQMAAAMATYHKGLIDYRICRYPAGSPEQERAALTEECLDQHILTQATIPSTQMPGGRYYFLGNATDSGYDPPRLFYSTFQLPEGLVCDGESWKCVLQMHYITGNTCNDVAIPDKFKLSYLSTCGEDGTWPEEFWNCADIAILPKGSSSTENGVVIDQPDSSKPAFSPALMQGPSTASKAGLLSDNKTQHPALFAFIVQKTFHPSKKPEAVQQDDGDKPRSWRRALKFDY